MTLGMAPPRMSLGEEPWLIAVELRRLMGVVWLAK